MGGKSGRNERVAACVEGIIAWRVRRHRERYGPGAEAGKEADHFSAAERVEAVLRIAGGLREEPRASGARCECLAHLTQAGVPWPLGVHDKRRCGDSNGPLRLRQPRYRPGAECRQV